MLTSVFTSRRTLCSRVAWPSLLIAIGCCGMLTAIGSAQQSASLQRSQGRKVTLHDQLTVGLRARTAADRAFLGRVVTAVETGRLPRRLVDSTFLWARNRAARKSRSRRLRPMVYFQPALTLRARRLGITI